MWYEMFEIAVFAALLWGAWRLGVRDGKMLGRSSSAQIAPPVPRPENVVFRETMPPEDLVFPDEDDEPGTDEPGEEDQKLNERLKEIEIFDGWKR